MATLLLGTTIGMVLTLIVLAMAKSARKAPKATDAPVVEVSAIEQEEIIKNYGGKAIPFAISDNVFGEVTNLNVDWVEAYGTRYMNLSTSLDCTELLKEEVAAIKKIDASLGVIRSEKMSTKRYLDVKDMLDGKVYVYQPCKMKLDVDSRPARIGLEMVRNADLSMTITTIMVSKLDVTLSKDRYEFDMLNLDDVESFDLLVRENNDYLDEVVELQQLEERLAHYNGLVSRNRVGMEADGNIVIYPPSPEEIKASRKTEEPAAPKTVMSTAESIKEAIEEFVSSASL